MDNRIITLDNIDNQELSHNVDDLLPYLPKTEKELKKEEEFNKILSDNNKILNELSRIENELCSEDMTQDLIKICEAVDGATDMIYKEKIKNIFENILENIHSDFVNDKKNENFKYNLIVKIKKLLNQMEDNSFLKDTVILFDSKTKFRRLLEEREKYLLEEINKRGLLNKKRINNEKRRKRQIMEEKEMERLREKLAPNNFIENSPSIKRYND